MNIFRNRNSRGHDLESAPDLAPTILALEAAYHAPVPTMRFNPAAAAAIPDIASHHAPRRWKPAVAIVAMVVLAFAAIAPPLTRDGHPQTVSAKELLAKAEAALAQQTTTSYHMVSVSELIDSGVVQTTERWYQNARVTRSETRIVFPNGVVTTDNAVENDDGVWWQSSRNGLTKAVHGLPGGPIHNGTLAAGVDIPTMVAMYAGPYTCRSASVARQEVLGARTAFVLRVVPEPSTCTTEDTIKATTIAAAAQGAYDLYWIDSTTFLPIRSEHWAGKSLRARTEVTAFETDVTFPPSTFTFTPDPGVVVHDVTCVADLCTHYFGVGCPSTPSP